MKTLKQFITEIQTYQSDKTSLNQISAGLKKAAQSFIKPDSINVDVGGGKYDLGINHIEQNVPGAKLHVYDPFNRTTEHNDNVVYQARNKAHYVGLHNVLNVINDEDARREALETVKSFMHPTNGIAHITIYPGNNSGVGKVTKNGSSWQENRPAKSYMDEISRVFNNHNISFKSGHIVITHK